MCQRRDRARSNNTPLPLMTARPLLQHVNEVNDLALHFLDLAVARFELAVDRDAALAGP